MQITIRTSKRATRLRLVSGIDGVHAVVPPIYDTDDLSRFVESKRAWVQKTSRYYSRLREKCGTHEPGTIFFRGERYRFNVVSDHRFSAIISDEIKVVTFHIPDRRKFKSYLEEWYRQQTATTLGQRLEQIAESMGLKYNKFRIKKQSSRWGSCSKKKNLNFNLMLAAAPPEVVDYVLIHELAHLTVLDHSERFWALVGSFDPDYRIHKEWLSKFAPLIKIA